MGHGEGMVHQGEEEQPEGGEVEEEEEEKVDNKDGEDH